MRLPVADIRMDGGTQPRSALDSEVIAEYAALMVSGERFPPVAVFYDGDAYWLADGFHRTRAAIDAQIEEIDAEIIQGSQDDAKWFSFSVNKGHGLRRTNEDKQRVVQAALLHPRSQELSDTQIAKHVGVTQQTVSNWRSRLVSSNKLCEIESRTVTRNGTTYQQDVSNIGRTREVPEQLAALSSAMADAPTIELPTLSRERVWAAQETRHFTKELLRLIKAYEKSHDPVEALLITHEKNIPTKVEIVTRETAE